MILLTGDLIIICCCLGRRRLGDLIMICFYFFGVLMHTYFSLSEVACSSLVFRF